MNSERIELSKSECRENFHVLVVGAGKLAEELLKNLCSPRFKSVLPWSLRHSVIDGKKVVVHAGSGRELGDVLSYCEIHRSSLVELATGNGLESIRPTFPIIVCPNTNILMLKFMAMLKSAGHLFAEFEKSLVESHQSDKKTEPGTAISLAKSLGLSADAIVSIRDPLVQQQLGIAAEHLGRHAYHRINIAAGNVSVTFETKVLGHAPYAEGLSRILEGLDGKALQPGKYDVVDLVAGGWI